MTSKEALLKLKEIAEHLTRKQWLELTSNIELIRNYLQKQEKLLELYKDLTIKERKRATSLKTRNVDKYNQLNKEIEVLSNQIKELEE